MKTLKIHIGGEKVRKGRIPYIILASPWLEKAGFKEGKKATAFITPGRLLIVAKKAQPIHVHQAQALLGTFQEILETMRDSLLELHSQLPHSPLRMTEGRTPMTVAPSLGFLIESLLEQEIEPAVEKLSRGASVTPADLREEWQEKYLPPVCK